MYRIIKYNDELRVIEESTGKFEDDSSKWPIGIRFQFGIMTPEWKSAMIVYEKYKRKLNLEYSDLINLKDWIIDKVGERKLLGKNTSKDFMIQLCSEEIKYHKK